MSDIVKRLRERAAELDENERPLSDATVAADEIERLRAAIRWALGEAPDDRGAHFGDERPPLEARYWWRTTLRRMAGMGDLVYDKEGRTIVDRSNQQLTEQEPK